MGAHTYIHTYTCRCTYAFKNTQAHRNILIHAHTYIHELIELFCLTCVNHWIATIVGHHLGGFREQISIGTYVLESGTFSIGFFH